MDEYEIEEKCQSYEVTDFQHNFEINHPTTTLQQWGLHIHSTHYELLVFIRGNAECWIEGRRKKLEYGDVVIVNPREIHRIFILDNAEYERIVIHVSDSMIKELSTAQTNLLRVFHKNRAHILHLSEEEMAQFVSNQLQMKKMWKKKEFGADLLGSAWFQILLLQISQKMRQAEGSGAWESVAGLVGEALEYVNAHMTEDISVQDIADALNVSRYYLSHAFKKSTGYGLWNYVISKRLVYSQKLLVEGASVTEACYESGFKDYAHFIKSFTKTFGCSPKQYGKNDASIYTVKLNAADAAIDRDSRCIYIHDEAKFINKELKN